MMAAQQPTDAGRHMEQTVPGIGQEGGRPHRPAPALVNRFPERNHALVVLAEGVICWRIMPSSRCVNRSNNGTLPHRAYGYPS